MFKGVKENEVIQFLKKN